jgi:pyridoxal biosynthesis lyase PdxS
MELGSHGILVASGIVKANSWEKKITELASGMKG